MREKIVCGLWWMMDDDGICVGNTLVDDFGTVFLR